jgi:hypothetical protein
MSKYKFFEYGYINKVTDEWGYITSPPMSDDNDGWDNVVTPPKPEDTLNDYQRITTLKPLTLKMKLARILLKPSRKPH